MLGLGEGFEEPGDLGGVERGVDFDGGVAGDGGGDAAGAGAGVFGLLVGGGGGEEVFEGEFEGAAFEAYGGGFDGEGAGAEGFGLEAVAIELFGELGEADHLCGEEVDEDGQEEALALGGLRGALAEDFFEEDALVGDVLVDDPEAFVVGGEDEGVADLAEGLEGGEGVEGVLYLRAAGAEGGAAGVGGEYGWVGRGVGIVADGEWICVELEAAGDGWELGIGEGEGGGVVRVGVGLGEGAVEGVGCAIGVEVGLVQAFEGGSTGAVEGSGDVAGRTQI